MERKERKKLTKGKLRYSEELKNSEVGMTQALTDKDVVTKITKGNRPNKSRKTAEIESSIRSTATESYSVVLFTQEPVSLPNCTVRIHRNTTGQRVGGILQNYISMCNPYSEK